MIFVLFVIYGKGVKSHLVRKSKEYLEWWNIQSNKLVHTWHTKAEKSEIILGYWAIRGLAEPIRLLMEYTGFKYTEKKYSGEDWTHDKSSLGFDFPNLPYLIHSGKKLTESDAIMQYVCLKSGHGELLGKTDDDKVKLALVKGVFTDARGSIYAQIYGKDYDKNIKSTLDGNLKPKFDNLNKFMGKGQGLIGSGRTYIDFSFYEFSQLLLTMDSKMFDKWENLQRLNHEIENLDAIKKYKASNRFVARPFNGGSAAYNPK